MVLALTSSPLVIVNCAPPTGAPISGPFIPNTVPENCQGPVEGVTLDGVEQAAVNSKVSEPIPKRRAEHFTHVLSAFGPGT